MNLLNNRLTIVSFIGRLSSRIAIVIIFGIFLSSCNKLVSIPPPTNSLTLQTVFNSDTTAFGAVEAIYSDMSSQGPQYANSLLTFFCGLSADELSNGFPGDHFFSNKLNSNDLGEKPFWSPPYFDIYMANGVLQGLSASNSISRPARNEIAGEAKFFRAFCYFYLTNLYGDIPLVLTTDFNETSILPRVPQSAVYQQIISDLIDAQNLLGGDYSYSNGERIRANRWAALALLARTYLYTQKWESADSVATLIINQTSMFSLDSLNGVFLKNSNEAILQLQTPNRPPYATREGNILVPCDGCTPNYYLVDGLVNAFEASDDRRNKWVDSINIGGTFYYFPYKYKVGISTDGNVTEYYTLFRLAEQYLIRAEAETEEAKLQQAVSDLNVVRNRALLSGYSGVEQKDSILNAIAHENQIEFFSEMGHRWFDLKRTGFAHKVLSSILYKEPWLGDYQLYYPLPLVELQADPELKQNPGY